MTNSTRSVILQTPSAAGLLQFLAERYDMAHASDSELQFLADCLCVAVDAASSLSTVTSAVGCLIAGDRSAEHKHARSGALQEADQSILLHRIANEIELIGQIVATASDAECTLRKRLIDRLKAERFCRIHSDEYSSQEERHG
ncbi:hypothetical protein AWB80_03371 [Caballeronia pedi]|uniref:Uncharacterized protein n=2 Tax=Caballeronia pedi TaxID=1777141 RepID=A0A158BCZ1_9BURK|nr:hypothetical protein [Caballeronia pedi]SAK67938.1 hypothetical protein AWB80_03371 [Caballeronia pedi]